MARTKENVYWELVRRYREFENDRTCRYGKRWFPIREEPLGLYCTKNRAMIEREIYIDTELHEVEGEETVELKIRKYKETIEEVDMISTDELDELAEMYG